MKEMGWRGEETTGGAGTGCLDLGGQRRKGCQLSRHLTEGRGSLCAGAGGGGGRKMAGVM